MLLCIIINRLPPLSGGNDNSNNNKNDYDDNNNNNNNALAITAIYIIIINKTRTLQRLDKTMFIIVYCYYCCCSCIILYHRIRQFVCWWRTIAALTTIIAPETKTRDGPSSRRVRLRYLRAPRATVVYTRCVPCYYKYTIIISRTGKRGGDGSKRRLR